MASLFNNRDFDLTAGNNGFQLLGTHHRAQPGAGGGAAVVGHDAGN